MAKAGPWKNGIRREASGSYTVTWYERATKRKRMKRGLPDRETAKAYKSDREQEQLAARDTRPETADSLVARYKRDFCRHRAKTTAMWYEERLGKFGEDFKGRRLSRI